MKLIFVSSNEKKVSTFLDLTKEKILSLGYDLEVKTIPELPEIQGNCQEVIIDKTTQAYNYLKEPCIVDDESFLCEGLNGFPGPYLKDFEATLLAKGIYDVVSNSKSPFCYPQVSYGITFNGKEVFVFQGKIKAFVISPREGYENSKNYFEVLQSEEYQERLSILDESNKGKYIMRREALAKLLIYLSDINNIEINK